MTKSYTLPLSRWHHVADRIRESGDRQQKAAMQALGQTQLNPGVPVNEAQIDALRKRGEKALTQTASARKAMEVAGHIRIALARANAEKGITELLALAEAHRRVLRLLNEWTGLDLVTRVPLDNLLAVAKDAPAAAAPNDLYGRRQGLPVNLLPLDAFDATAADIADLEAQISAVTDQVADLNRTPLTLDLPEDLAKAAGL